MEDNYKDFWDELRAYLKDFNEKHSYRDGDYAVYGRYCVSISIEDLLEKMDEIEKK